MLRMVREAVAVAAAVGKDLTAVDLDLTEKLF